MDVHCSSCGEPWDTYHLLHDLVYETGLDDGTIRKWKRLPAHQQLEEAYRREFAALGFEFGRTLMNVVSCPSCSATATPDPEKVLLKAALERMLEDDVDGLAAHIEEVEL